MIDHEDAAEKSPAECRSRSGGSTRPILLLGVVILACTAIVLFQLLSPSLVICSEPAHRIRCASRLKQIGLALQMYSNDHGNILPPSFDEIILHSDVEPEVFNCPHTNDTPAAGSTPAERVRDFKNPGHCSYFYATGSVPMASMTPAHVLAYEPLANNDGDGINALMGDGHTEWISKHQATHVIAELQAGFNPPRPMPAASAP